MSETAEKIQHTPGPWTIAAWTSHGRIVCTLKNKRTISKYIGYAQGYPEPDSLSVGMEEAEANARLLAAAPEMLKALESELESLNEWLESDDINDDIKGEMLQREYEIERLIQKVRG